MKTMLAVSALALLTLDAAAGAAARAMPVTALEQAAPAAATQVYHRGRPHYRRYPRASRLSAALCRAGSVLQ